LGWGRDRDAADYLERALPPARAIGRHSHWLLGNVGLVALLAGDSDAAREAFREELALSRDVVVPLATAQALSGLAAVAASDDKPEAAARLAGAGAAHRSRVPDDPLVARLDTTFLEPARTRFGAQEWDAAFGEGAALSLEEAIVYGLAGMPAPSTAGLASPPPVSAGREL
jgi:hypothetical protein